LTDGLKKEVAKLSAGQAVTISPGLWRDIYPLSEGDVLLVMASDNYDESDYIRDFDEFRRWKVA
jgi:dTDP-4-dehydrorhamnose 3,5-epimerase-like enzyme